MLVDFQTTQATGTAERDTVPVLVGQAKERGFHPKTMGGEEGYDARDCVADLRERGVTPHLAQNTKGRSSASDGRITRHAAYAISQRIRKRVEEIFGWMKTVGGFRRTRYRGLDRTGGIPGSHGLQTGPAGQAAGISKGNAGCSGGMTRPGSTCARSFQRAELRSPKGLQAPHQTPHFLP